MPSTKTEKDKTVMFVTNRDDVDRSKAVGFARRYRRRWQIENQYKTIKHEFLARTSSKDYRVRLFYFVFAALLYNIWHLTSALLKATGGQPAADGGLPLSAGELVDRVGQYLRAVG